MNRKQALINALTAVSLKKTDALNQQRIAREIGDDSLVSCWQGEADEAEQTYRELLAMLGECHEPQASPDDSTDRTGATGRHYEDVAGNSDSQSEQETETRCPVYYETAGGESEGHKGGAENPVALVTGNVPGDKTVSGTIAASTGIDATGRDGCLIITGGADHD